MSTTFCLMAILAKRDIRRPELAAKAGLSLRTVNRLYYNETEQVALSTLDALATVLKVKPGDLIARQKGKLEVRPRARGRPRSKR